MNGSMFPVSFKSRSVDRLLSEQCVQSFSQGTCYYVYIYRDVVRRGGISVVNEPVSSKLCLVSESLFLVGLLRLEVVYYIEDVFLCSRFVMATLRNVIQYSVALHATGGW